MFGIGAQEMMIILLIVLVIFGGKKIPELMSGLGKGVRSFKKGMNEPDEDEVETPKKAVKREAIEAGDDEEEEVLVVRKKKSKTEVS